MIILVPCIIFSFLYSVIIVILYRGLRSLSLQKQNNSLTFSIVIAARNEEKNIIPCLQSVAHQSIASTQFEIVLVNDRSNDTTLELAREFATTHPQLHIITIEKTPPGISPKKHAVQEGIRLAKNEVIVFTDADCRVLPTWLETIGNNFDTSAGLVQGITTYEYQPGMNRFFFGIQAVDFLSHGIVAAAAIGAGVPINSNANNLAFRKKAFDDAFGYGTHNAVISGDDDMLLQRIWKKTSWKIRFMADPKGAVLTEPSKTPKAAFEQRKRWGSKTVHYNAKQVVLLSIIFLFYLCSIVMLGIGFIKPMAFVLFAGMMIIKLCGEALLMVPGTRLFGQMQLRKYIVIGSIIQLPMVLMAVLMGVFGKFVWKEQVFKRKAHRGN